MVESIANIRFINVCNFIKENYSEISKEFEAILGFVDRVCSIYKSYTDKNMITAHIQNLENEEYPLVETLCKKLALINEEAVDEFFQGYDFINLKATMTEETNTDLFYVIDVKRAVNYIIYGLERVKKLKDIKKQISVLKGMIALS